MNKNILIGIHAYTEAENGKSEISVIKDRIDGAIDCAEKYKNIGGNIAIVFLGGLKIENKTTAEITKEIANEHRPAFVSEFETIIADEYGSDTKNELKSFIKLADEINPELIVSVSSKDHVPRIIREMSKYDKEYGVTVYPSQETYVKDNTMPFILEGPYKSYIEPFNRVLDIPLNLQNEVAEDIDDVIDDYK